MCSVIPPFLQEIKVFSLLYDEFRIKTRQLMIKKTIRHVEIESSRWKLCDFLYIFCYHWIWRKKKKTLRMESILVVRVVKELCYHFLYSSYFLLQVGRKNPRFLLFFTCKLNFQLLCNREINRCKFSLNTENTQKNVLKIETRADNVACWYNCVNFGQMVHFSPFGCLYSIVTV